MSTQRTNFGPLFQTVGKGFDVAKAREVMGRPAPTAPHNGTDTSRQAAKAIDESGVSATQRESVLTRIDSFTTRTKSLSIYERLEVSDIIRGHKRAWPEE